MVNTYTSNWITVSNGDVTTHNLTEILGTNDIDILSAEIQWEGVATDGSDSTETYVPVRLSVSTTVPPSNDGVDFTREIYNEQYYLTDDPKVTRDVSGDSGGILLSDGEQSNWYTLNGFEKSNNEIYHNISESQKAYFRFRFDWEPSYPTALKELRIRDKDDSKTYKVALADPTDSQLQYDVVRTAIDGTVYAVDVVKPSNASAIETHRIYHSTHSILCPRTFDTV